ncbi:MAG: hypothetical protein COA96_13990 [SAR86 cluster bacterium]|uniref:Ice-binding protein C-terminal domain-containing protein n=1 Tax=SAR86 cluster bacterium TaxID=2030880 RepID=A0A2A5ATL6_9GAMM|nr:MAG: hypothetical protein COA96_13990 [SAR86 cluster bacterium]
MKNKQKSLIAAFSTTLILSGVMCSNAWAAPITDPYFDAGYWQTEVLGEPGSAWASHDAHHDVSYAIGAPSLANTATGFLSIAIGETLVMQFTNNRVIDGVGDDFQLWEVGVGVSLTHLFAAEDDGIWVAYGVGSGAINGGGYAQGFDLSDFAGLSYISQLMFHGHDNGGGSKGYDLAGAIALNSQAAPVPEPSTMALLGFGMAFLGFRRRLSA